MDYEKMYKEALERAQKINIDDAYASQGTVTKMIFPELAESEDEKMYKAALEGIEYLERNLGWDAIGDIDILDVMKYLKKQKPVKSDTEKEYVRILKSIVSDFIRDKKPKDTLLYQDIFDWLDGRHIEQKKAEGEGPHYTKRNALFDECVKNCDPKTVEEVNKRVDDIMNMPKLSHFEQALTNFIGDWEDDEEHWPSQFVKKHGKHILDMAREELQKEQKPSSTKFRSGDWVVYDGPLGHAILQVKDVVGGRYSFVDNVSTLLAEDSDEFLRPLTPEDVEKPAEKQDYSGLNNLERAIHRGFLSAGIENIPVTIIKETAKECLAQMEPAEWSEEDKSFYDSIMCEVAKEGMHPTPEQVKWLKSLPERFNLQPKEEWDDDDKAIVGCIACYLDGQFITEGARKQCQEWFNRHRRDFLNSSSWKPSKEQMEALLNIEGDLRAFQYNDKAKIIAELYEQLKKL